MTRPVALAIVLGLAALVQPAAQAPRKIAVRFHHLHYSVADPGSQLRPSAEALRGTRAIVPGVGVGVRVEREYLLFARATDGSSMATRRAPRPADAYAAAVRWLSARGFEVTPRTLGETSVGRSLPEETLDHIAFAADDLAAAIAASGAKPSSRTEDTATFRLGSAGLLELVRDTDRPDAFWCPMHPDVRSPGTGKCPICGMALVPIPPLRPGEYRLDARLVAGPDGGASRVRLAVRDPDTGAAVASFLDVHERPFHLFIISRDLELFVHVHPSMASDGTFDLQHTLTPGVYLLIADFLPTGATSQLVHRMVATPGHTGPLFTSPPAVPDLPAERIVSGLRIRMQTQPVGPRRATPIRFEIADARTGAPVTDLEPYLGAPGHLLVVDNDLTAAVHGHPEAEGSTGSAVTFAPVLPASGRYKLWLQIQRKGEVITAPFVIDVPQEIR